MTDRTNLVAVAQFAEDCRADGELGLAEQLQRRVYDVVRGSYSGEPLDALRAKGNLGVTQLALGRHKQAHELLGGVLNARRGDSTRTDDVSDLVAAHNYAASLAAIGDFTQARSWQQWVARRQREDPHPDHPSALVCANNYAITVLEMGDVAQAQSILESALEHRDLTSARPDLMMLAALTNLSAIYLAAGALDLAESTQRQVAELSVIALADNHPDLLLARRNLGSVLCAQGRLREATELLTGVVASMRAALGANHPHTLVAVANLALTAFASGDLAGAREMLDGVAEALSEELGQNHPDVLRTVGQQATMRRAAGEVAQGRAELATVLVRSRRVLGDTHPVTIAQRIDLAGMLQQDGDLDDAAEHYVDILGVDGLGAGDQVSDGLGQADTSLGASHPSVLAARHGLAAVRHLQNRSDEALTGYHGVVEAYRAALGRDHVCTLTAQLDYGRTLYECGSVREAVEIFTTVSSLALATLGREHPLTRAAARDLSIAARARARFRGSHGTPHGPQAPPDPADLPVSHDPGDPLGPGGFQSPGGFQGPTEPPGPWGPSGPSPSTGPRVPPDPISSLGGGATPEPNPAAYSSYYGTPAAYGSPAAYREADANLADPQQEPAHTGLPPAMPDQSRFSLGDSANLFSAYRSSAPSSGNSASGTDASPRGDEPDGQVVGPAELPDERPPFWLGGPS